MREKYESLSAVVLRDLAKARGLKYISNKKKSELVEMMLAEDERQAGEKQEENRQGEGEQTETGDAPRAESAPAEAAASKGAGSAPAEAAAPKETGNAPVEAAAPKGAGNTPTERANPRRFSREGSVTRMAGNAPAVRTGTRGFSREGSVTREKGSFRGGTGNRDGNVSRDGTGNRDGNGSRDAAGSRDFSYGREAANGPGGSRDGNGGRDGAGSRDGAGGQGDFQREGSPRENTSFRDSTSPDETLMNLDSGYTANGILEVMPDGYGFIRSENYLPGDSDVYVSPSQIRKFNLKTGDIVTGNTRVKTQQEKFSALLYVSSINGCHPSVAQHRKNFEDLTPIFPNRRLRLERSGSSVAMRIVDLVSPIGKGQRGMIVSQPKAGKTTLLKDIARSITTNDPRMHLIILLIDERPEEVTDIKECIEGDNVEVIYSTFDELPEHHKRVSEMVIERAKRLVEHGMDVTILLDSITRLTRAYNLTVPPSGRTLSGGLDPAALHMPKRFFGAARNMREGGSLTILATALVQTGSKMDDVIYEEFKGTGNMELVLDRKLSEKRVFPAIDIVKSSTRREDLLLDPQEQEAVDIMRKAINGMRTDDAVESIINMFSRTRNNQDFINMVKKTRIL